MPNLGPEHRVLRAVSYRSHVEEVDGGGSPLYILSRDAVMLADLEAVLNRDGKPRSLSTVIFCECSDKEIEIVKEKLRRDPELTPDHGGASVSVARILTIQKENNSVFSIEDDPKADLPNHASIRFNSSITLTKPEKRIYRDDLIKSFGNVLSIEKLRQRDCIPSK